MFEPAELNGHGEQIEYRPVNVAGVSWVESGRQATFASSRPGFGVEHVRTGELLSKDGVVPSVWRTKAVAMVIAQYPPSGWSTVKLVTLS